MFVINADSPPHIVKKKTNLGDLERADTFDMYSEAATIDDDQSGANTDIIQRITEGLPADLTDYQRGRVRDPLLANESIFSKGEYDMILGEHR